MMLSLQETAANAAGNWKRFHGFVWFRRREIDDAERWTVIYTHNRDSGLLDQSNASVIRKTLEPFECGNDPDVVFESHSRWAVGHVDGFSLRVFHNGEITEAFQRYHELVARMNNYPILDESDYSARQHEATLENIELAAWKVKQQFHLPQD